MHTLNRILLTCLLPAIAAGCAVDPGVNFDPGKVHHGDGEFVSVKKASFWSHFFMRMREDDPVGGIVVVRIRLLDDAGRGERGERERQERLLGVG